jgi:hypothetical protein
MGIAAKPLLGVEWRIQESAVYYLHIFVYELEKLLQLGWQVFHS